MLLESILIFLGGSVAGAVLAAMFTNRRAAELRVQLAQRETEVDLLQKAIAEKDEQLGNSTQQLESYRQEIIAVNTERERLRTSLTHEQELRREEADKFKQMQENHFSRFRNLAGEIMEENTGKLKASNKEQMDTLLAPLRVQLENLSKAVTDTNRASAGNKASLEAAIKAMMEKTESLGRDAENLTLALRGNTKKQGDWGEMILERMLEESGLRKNEEYYVQETQKTDEGNVRPDVIIRFPENKCVIVDSKVSLTAYALSVAAEEEAERSNHLRAHVASVRKHIDERAAKDYSATVQGSISYVLMFIPNEASYMAALQADSSLPMDAYRKKIILISPTNLLMALQLAYNLWQKERQTRNVENIIDRASKLYDKLATVQESLDKVGKSINQAQDAYAQAFKQLFHGRGCYAKQLGDLRQMGISPNKRLALTDDAD